MNILENAMPIRIEPTINGVIVYISSARDPYSDAGRIAETYVFTEMVDLLSFVEKQFIGEVKREISSYKIPDPIYAIDGSPFYGGGS